MLHAKTKKIIILSLSLLMAVLCLSSCFMGLKFEFDSGSIVNSRGDRFSPVPLSYKPRSYVTDDEYARLDHPIYGKINLYEVADSDGKWLYCSTDDTLYKTDDAVLPTLAEMEPTSILVTSFGEKEISLANVTDKKKVSEFVDLVVNGTADAITETGMIPSDTYKIAFLSEKYPFLAYSMTYYEYSDGSYYIYNRDTGLYYKVDDTFKIALENIF